jgi:PKD repeat protein
VYSAAGTYTVSLKVTGPGGTNTQTRTSYITVTSSGGGADRTPPSAPRSLVATTSSRSTINLTWNASTDNVGVTRYVVERCLGVNCTNFAAIGSTSGTGFMNSRLPAGATYSYRVRAVDAAGNMSGYSNTAQASTQKPDSTKPSAPQALSATPIGANSIALRWSPSTDNGQVAKYLIERCTGLRCSNFATATPDVSVSTAHDATGLSAGTTYGFRVKAVDAAGNVSGYSNTAAATTATGASSSSAVGMAQIAFAVPQTPQSTVSLNMTQAQTSGNLNVVVVGWNDTTSAVASVTDSRGNVYVRAVGPTVISGALSQSIYYAKNIGGAAAGGNTVTVRFNAAARFADVRVVEYSGLDRANPVDTTAGASGSGTISNSGSATVTHARDLLFAANTVTGATQSAGSGFTSRLITSPDADIVQDRFVTATGVYNATAPISGGSWVMQLVAFKAAP